MTDLRSRLPASRMLALILGVALALAGLCFVLPDRIMDFFYAGRPDRDQKPAAAAALKLSGLILIPIILGDFVRACPQQSRAFFFAAGRPHPLSTRWLVGTWACGSRPGSTYRR